MVRITNPIKTFDHVLDNSSMTPFRIKKMIGIIENPKISIDFMECFISKAICFLETSIAITLFSIFLRSNSLQLNKNRVPTPKYKVIK
jgi:hypothetical protein